MFKVNTNYQKLPGSYLFSTIAKKVSEYAQAHPEKTLIRLGIGDVTLPLPPAVTYWLSFTVTRPSPLQSWPRPAMASSRAAAVSSGSMAAPT